VRTLIRASLASVLSLFVFIGPVSAATNTATTIAQATQTGTISGHVTGDNGSAVASATVVIDGSGQHQATTTDDSGNFTASLPAGLYTVSVTKGGFQPGSSDVTVASGTAVTVNVGLTATSLSNLNVIGRTSTTSGAAAKFNISSSQQQQLTQTQLTIRNTPDLTSELQELPGVTIPHATSNPNQSFIIRGLRYETKTTIDGHPVSSGTSGTFLTNYTSSSIFGGVDVVQGGGLNGPLSAEAGAGIVNLRTPDFTAKDGAFLQGALDSYNGSLVTAIVNVNALNNKLQFVFGKTFTGYRGPTYNAQEADYSGATPPIGTGQIPALSNGVIRYINDFSDTYGLNSELAKMRINFSSATSLSLGFLGLQGNFQPQGGAYGQFVGYLTVPQCTNANVAGAGAACTVTSNYNSPDGQNLIGQTIPAYAFYPGSFVQQNQPNFNADFRTTIGNDTVLFRPYTANIRRLIDGTQENDIPGDAGNWFQVTNSANCQVAFVGATVANGGAKGPCFASGATPVGAYVTDPNTPHVFATTATPLVCTVTTPCYTTSTAINNGGQYGYGSPYTTLEIDKLSGYTFSYIHPFGANTFNLSFDHYYDDAQSLINDASPLAPGCSFVLGSGVANTPGKPGYQSTCGLPTLRPSPISVPETFSSISSLSGSATFAINSKLSVDLGAYFTHYLINGQQLSPTVYANYLAGLTPATSAYAGGVPIVLSGVQNAASHFDPRFGLTFRANRDLVFRFSAGSSLNIPYAGLVSGFTTYAQGATSITQSTPNPSLLPEEIVSLDLGSDYRTPDGTVLSGDIYNTVVHNPWINPQVQICNSNISCAAAFPGLEQTTLGYTSTTVNGAQQYAQGIEFSITHEPAKGFGYRVNSSFERLYYLGTNPLYLATPQVYFNGNQYVSTGSGSTSVPYAKGYAEIQYASSNKSLLRFGMDYEGNNNEYNAPAFFIFDGGARVNTGFHDVMLGVSVENMFNQNFNALLGRGVEYQGLAPVTAVATTGGYTYGRGTYNTALVSPGPQTFRFTLTKQF
jgi:hypothetical protein